MSNDISIYDVVEIFGLPKARHSEMTHYTIPCPFCDDKSKQNGHLDINLTKDSFRCVKCGTAGGALGFYCFLSGWEDSKENRRNAAEAIREHFGGEVKVRQKPKQKIQERMAPIEVRDKTYSVLLEELRLTRQHKANLIDRGLTEDEIINLGYKSFPYNKRKEICARLIERGCTLKGVPGFYYWGDSWIFGTDAEPGFLIPFKNVDGKIQGIQKRYDNVRTGGKYRWISSRDMSYGTGAISWSHYVGTSSPEKIIITEGGLKGDIINAFSNANVLCIPGVNAIAEMQKELEILQSRGLKKIYTAFDMDFLKNEQVEQAYETLIQLIEDRNIEFSVMLWDDEFKGLDDFLAKGEGEYIAIKGKKWREYHAQN